MSARVFDTLLPRLRHEPTRKRVRATVAGEVVVDSTEAVLVWEPYRIVPAYAVPPEHIRGELVLAAGSPAPGEPAGFRLPDGRTVLDPSVPFSVHSTEGEPLSLRTPAETRHDVAFRPADPDLDGLVVLDMAGFDAWFEEDEQVHGHARDPFNRIDVLPSSRAVRIELDGTVLAESARAQLLIEHPILPVRTYMPAEDVRVPLRPSATRTRCPYKGEARYWSLNVDGRPFEDVAWTYEAPRDEVARIAGLVCFFDERVDVSVDGQGSERPRSPWSAADGDRDQVGVER
jgi:uncharacterized protein (DUF427 family)